MSADSIVQDFYNPAHFNRYAYCLNNPLIYIDPTGHITHDFAGFGGSFDFSDDDWSDHPGSAKSSGELPDGFLKAALEWSPNPVTETVDPVLGVAEVFRGFWEGDYSRAALGVGTAFLSKKLTTTAKRFSSNTARRKAMRQQGIPTSQQPLSQSRNASGRSYEYEVPKPGGGKQPMSVQQQTMDRSHPGQGHWEAGKVKMDPISGQIRTNQYGRPKLANDKSKVNYYE